MRIFVVTLIVLVAVIAAGLAAAPRLIDWNDYRGLLTSQAEAMTGGTVTINGHVDLSLLPTPTLTLAQTSVSSSGGGLHARLAVDRIDLRLRFLPLLVGDVQIGDIRLVRPVLEVERPSPDEASAPDADGSLLSLTAIRPDRLTVVDGRAALHDGAARWRLGTIDVEAVGQGQDGPFALRGGFQSAGRSFDLEATIGRLSSDRVGTLQLTLAALGQAPASLRYNGAVWWQADNPRLRGELVLAGQDAGAAAMMVSETLGLALPASSVNRPFEIGGSLQLDRDRLQMDDLRVQLAEARMGGRLGLAFGASPTMTLDLQAEALELDGLLAARLADLAPLVALSDALRGEIDLSVAALRYRERAADRVRLRLILSGDGEIEVEQASAILPGQTDLRFTGHVAGVGDLVRLRGHVDAVTDDLGTLLGWVDLMPPGIASGRLRTLSVSSALAVDGDGLRLSQSEVRVDASQLRGSAAWRPGGATDGVRPRLTADVVLDRLNVDAYRNLLPAEAAGLLQPVLRAIDAEVDARIERLTWGGLLIRDAAIAMRAEAGRLQVSDASFEMAGEADARLSGEADLESGTFAWSAEAHANRIAQLLRRLGMPAPLMLSRAPPMTLTLAVAGQSGQFDLDAEIEDGMGRVAASGDAGWVDGHARYDLDLAIDYPDLDALIRPLATRTAPDAATPPASLSFGGKLIGTADEHTIAGSGRLGSMSLTGLLAAQPGPPRPRYDLQLSVGDPTSEMLVMLAELAGVQTTLLLDTPMLGNWPEQPFDLGWMPRFDGSVKLSAKGGVAQDGVQLDARLQDATLVVDRASLQLARGTLGSELTLEADGPRALLAGSLDLREVDATWLAGALDLDPVLEGSVDLHAEASAAGASAYDLVRASAGHIEMTMGGGRLIGDPIAAIRAALHAGQNDHAPPGTEPAEPGPGLPFSGLNARFSLDRGIASTEAVRLDVDGAATSVAGTVDFLLWTTDLTVDVAAPDHPHEPIALRIVGPLDRPQTRLTVPPALRAETAAP